MNQLAPDSTWGGDDEGADGGKEGRICLARRISQAQVGTGKTKCSAGNAQDWQPYYAWVDTTNIIVLEGNQNMCLFCLNVACHTAQFEHFRFSKGSDNLLLLV